MRVAIVGLGMMGCSLAHTFKKLGFYVVGCDISESHCKKAMYYNLVNEIMSIQEADKECDFIFLVTPPSSIISILKKFDKVNNTIYIDFASLKHDIVQNVPLEIKKNFIASHPMCGTENSGPDGYVDNLYENKTVIICNKENNSSNSLNKVLDLYEKISMNVVHMDSKTHDKYIGFISHVPHIISFALANSVLEQAKPSDIVNLRGAGFESMSRLAKSSPDLWSDILCNNRNNILEFLTTYIKQLQEVSCFLEECNKDKTKEWIKQSNKLQDLF